MFLYGFVYRCSFLSQFIYVLVYGKLVFIRCRIDVVLSTVRSLTFLVKRSLEGAPNCSLFLPYSLQIGSVRGCE